VKINNIEQVVTQELDLDSFQQPYKVVPSTQVVSQQIKCVSRMTFSQKLYKANKVEAEEYLHVIDANFLEKIKDSLNKLVKVSEAVSNTQVVSPKITCVSRMTFSQKLYKAKELEAEEV